MDYATNNSFFTNMTAPVVGASPHKEVQIWYSTNIADLVDEPKFTAPVGTVSIKTANADGMPGIDALVVMIKKEPGYDAANGDWLYEMRMPNGAVMNDDKGKPMSGPIAMCIQCHVVAKSRDYLAGTDMR